MTCGHPLAARAIRPLNHWGGLVTVCWACEVEAEVALRARATEYNEAEGSGLPESRNLASDACLSATTREAGVVASQGVVAQ